MRRVRKFQLIAWAALIAGATIFAALWLGLVPPRLNPLAPLVLSEPSTWFLDLKLSALKSDPAVCATVLKPPIVVSEPVGDQPLKAGCGWSNAVRVNSAAGVRVAAGTLTCEMAAALAMWLEYEVQPAAMRSFGQRVVSLHHMGSYACRNVIGAKLWTSHRSQHARANALDVASFTLADGRVVSVFKHWKTEGSPDSFFLHEVHSRACRYFRAALSPNFNGAHANHFHLDRGRFPACR